MTKEECEIETSKAIMEMRNCIADLEKENAELKAYNEKLLDGDIEKHNKIVELTEKCRQYEIGYAYERLYELRVEAESKLTRAKELIKRLIKATYGEGWNYSLQVKVEAEKFLKESE